METKKRCLTLEKKEKNKVGMRDCRQITWLQNTNEENKKEVKFH